MWELTPKGDRPEAQVLVTLPNGEQEYVDGFLYQKFRPAAAAGVATLSPAGPPHTRYRYLPRMEGTHTWQLRTPPGGILEQSAFVVAGAALSRPSVAAAAEVVTLPAQDDVLAGRQAVERALDRLACRHESARIALDAATGTVLLPDGSPDLARSWLLDATLRAAAAWDVAVILRLPAPPSADRAQLHQSLHFLVCRYAAMPALAAWELAASGEAAEAAARFLRAYDPRHSVSLAGAAGAPHGKPQRST